MHDLYENKHTDYIIKILTRNIRSNNFIYREIRIL